MRGEDTGRFRAGLWVLFALIAGCAALLAVGFLVPRGRPALHQAVIENDVARVKDLLEKGVPVDLEGPAHTTPLFYARSAEMADLLIQRGANVNAVNESGCSPIHFAAGLGAVDVMDALVRSGADPCAKDGSWNTPLHWATMFLGDSSTQFDHSGWSRSSERKIAATQYLLKHSVKVDARNSAGETPLFEAVADGPQLVECLIAAGADVRAATRDRHTPLHSAAFWGCDIAVVRLLLQHGADPRAPDWQGETPLSLARVQAPELVPILESWRPATPTPATTRALGGGAQ